MWGWEGEGEGRGTEGGVQAGQRVRRQHVSWMWEKKEENPEKGQVELLRSTKAADRDARRQVEERRRAGSVWGGGRRV